MRELILLYWGCILLMYLSGVYYPVRELPDYNSYRSLMRCKSDVFMVVAIAWMACFSFLRTNYNDTGNYIYGFEMAEPIAQVFSNGRFSNLRDNPLSELYTSIVREITDNYHVYFMIPALLNSTAAIKLFKRYSTKPTLSLLLFFSIGTYTMYIAAMKQCFAMFFLLLALPYILERKYVHFYILVFVAALFHSHALIFMIIPLMLGKPWDKFGWIVVATMIVVVFNYDQLMSAFVEITQELGLNVREDEVFDGHQINVLRVVAYWIPPLIALFFRRRICENIRKNEALFVNMSTVSAAVLTLGLAQGANLYGRMSGYFEIGTAVALPWMIQKVFTNQSAKIVSILAGILYFGYFLFEFGISKNFGTDYAAISLWEFIMELV